MSEQNIKPITIDYPCTTDYNRFKHLVGNRGVDLQRVAKIKASIEKRYIKSAITINDKWEIIDGQGRVQALKELGLPVYYVVDENATLDDCIRMNITSTPWETADYVYSGRDRGNENYIKLADLLDRYKLQKKSNGYGNVRTIYRVPLQLIIAVASGCKGHYGGSRIQNSLRMGLFVFTADYAKILNDLDYVADFYNKVQNFGVTASVLLFCKRCPDIDEHRVQKLIMDYNKNRERFPAYNSIDEAMLSFEYLYNYKMRNKLDFRALYAKYRNEDLQKSKKEN